MESVLAAAQLDVPGCLAAGYVNIPTGTLVCAGSVDTAQRDALGAAARAAPGLFDPRPVADLARFFGEAAASPEASSTLSEAVFLTDEMIHVYQRSRVDPAHALVVVCRRSANIGMAIARARLALPRVEAVSA